MTFKKAFFAFSLIAVSFSSLAAAQFTSSAPEKYLGTISVSGIRGDMDDAIHALQEKGHAIGGNHIRIIALSSTGDSDAYFGTAKVYSRY